MSPVLEVVIGEQVHVVIHIGSLHLDVLPEWLLLLIVLRTF